MTNEPEEQTQHEESIGLEGVLTSPLTVEADIVTDKDHKLINIGFRVHNANAPVVIDDRQAKRLDQLITSSATQSVVAAVIHPGMEYSGPEELNDFRVRFAKSRGELTKDDKLVFVKGFAGIRESLKDISDAVNGAYDVREKHSKGEIVQIPALLTAYRKAHDTLRDTLRRVYDDPRVAKMKRLLSRGVSRYTLEDQALILEGRRKYSLLDVELTQEFFALKLQRLDELMKISPLDAARYATAGLPSDLVTPELKELLDQDIDIDKDGVKAYAQFWNVDTEVYKKIIERFKVVPRAQPVKQIPEVPQPVVSRPEVSLPELTPYQKLHVAVQARSTHPVFREGKYGERTARLFLDYVYDNSKLNDDQVTTLALSFEEFNLPSWISRRSLSERNLKTFFDKVSLDYLEKGRVPKKRDLREIYLSLV